MIFVDGKQVTIDNLNKLYPKFEWLQFNNFHYEDFVVNFFDTYRSRSFTTELFEDLFFDLFKTLCLDYAKSNNIVSSNLTCIHN